MQDYPRTLKLRLIVKLFVASVIALFYIFGMNSVAQADSTTFWLGKTGSQCGISGSSICPEAINFRVGLGVTGPSSVEPGQSYTLNARGWCDGDDFSGSTYVSGGIQGGPGFGQTAAIFCPSGAPGGGITAGSVTLTAPSTPGNHCVTYFVTANKIPNPRASDYFVQPTVTDQFCVDVAAPFCDLGCGGSMTYTNPYTSESDDFTCPAGYRLEVTGGSWTGPNCSGNYLGSPADPEVQCVLDATCAAPPPQPPAPTLTAGSCGTGQITASWSNVSGATGYDLQYRPASGGSWVVRTNVSSGVAITGLSANTSYNFQLRAKNGTGNSSWSAYGTRTAPNICPPNQVTGVSAVPQACGSGTIRVTWNSVSGATGYDIRRDGGAWTNLGNVTAYNHTGLSAGSAHNYRIRAWNSGGAGTASSQVSANAPNNCPAATITAPNCTISAGNNSCTVSVSWSSSNTGTRSVRQDGSQFSTAAGSAGTNRTINYGSHTFAFFNNGSQIASDGATASCAGGTVWNGSICQGAPSQPPAPTLAAGSCGTGQITASWSNVSGATGYDLQYKLSSGSSWTVLTNVTSPRTVTGLIAGETYDFQLRAKNAAGNSSWSAYGSGYAPDVCTASSCDFLNPVVYEVCANGNCSNGRRTTSGPAGGGSIDAFSTWEVTYGGTSGYYNAFCDATAATGEATCTNTETHTHNGATFTIQINGSDRGSFSAASTAIRNCVEPPPPSNGACGTRATNYAYNVTAWPGGSTYCSTSGGGTSPAFPAQGSSANWLCYGQNGGSDASCTATRDAAPGCGTASGGTYTNAPSSNLCTAGGATWSDSNGNDGSFNWSCSGTSCSADHRPDAPTGLSATAGTCGTGQINLDWNDVAGASSYSVYYSSGTWVANTNGSNLTTLTGLNANQSYSFYVRANSPLGIQSANSGTVTQTAPDNCPVASVTIDAQVNGGSWQNNPSSITINEGDAVNLRWNGVNADSCAATGPGFATGGATTGTDDITEPAPGDFSDFSVTCTASGGDGSDTIRVNKNGQPDLRAAIGTVNPSPGFSATIPGYYEYARFNFQILNDTGTAGISDSQYRVQFESDEDGDGTYTSIHNVTGSTGAIADGSSYNRSNYTIYNVPPGPYRVTLTADSSNSVAEANEGNNVATANGTLAVLDPGLTIEADKTVVRAGDTATLTWTIDTVYPGMACTVAGPGVNEDALASNTTDTSAITAKSVYTLTCSVNGNVFEDSVTIEITGTFEEV